MTTEMTVWQRIAAPLPAEAIQWRQQGKPVQREGKYIARFVAYIDAQFVRERLDSVVPGEWDVTLSLLPAAVTGDGEEVEPFSFTAKLVVLDTERESVGSGKDYKTAETDAFKRAAVRYGVGSELYAMDPLWVQLDGDGKFAKPLESPAAVYARKGGQAPARVTAPARVLDKAGVEKALDMQPVKPVDAGGYDDIGATDKPSDNPACPKCEGRMWDNRLTKKNPKAPDFKCRDRTCDGVVWPPKATPQREMVPTFTLREEHGLPPNAGDEGPHPWDGEPEI